MKTMQLRDYTIHPGQLGRFVEIWTHSVLPLRRKYGFSAEGAWQIPTENRFVWVVSYDGPEDWEQANKNYYGSPERRALDPDPGKLIASARTVLVERV